MKFILAGYGGQGIMLMGTILARAATREGKFISQSPSYGAEMRGGASNNYVIVEAEPVVSPVVELADAAVIMEPGPLASFAPRVLPGGLLLLNGDLVTGEAGRDDVRVERFPANRLAREAGDDRTINLVTLGALAALTGVVKVETIRALLPELLTGRKAALIPANEKALALGHGFFR